MIGTRRPYLSSRVIDGLASIASRIEPQSDEEARAMLWIARARGWRLLSSSPLEPHDAEVCLPSAEPAKAGSAGRRRGKEAT